MNNLISQLKELNTEELTEVLSEILAISGVPIDMARANVRAMLEIGKQNLTLAHK